MSRGVTVLVFLAIALAGVFSASAQPLPYGYDRAYQGPAGPYAQPDPYLGDVPAAYDGYDRAGYHTAGPRYRDSHARVPRAYYEDYVDEPRRYDDGYGHGPQHYDDGYHAGPRHYYDGYYDHRERYEDRYYRGPGDRRDNPEDVLVPPEAEGPAEERDRGFDPRRPHLGDGTDAPSEQFYPRRPRSCGEYYYWDGTACVDARKYPPYVGPKR